ncbi:hypothetical protein, partial [Yokenella regensburgei]|uniref:hypothetical protein n=1 Tax=Yokenella regensburgei TaxID=158877 RepID=UPI0035AFD257
EVAYITLSSFRVKRLFSLFSGRISGETLSTRRLVCRCSVSMEAHYRDPIFLHKPFSDLFFCLMFFQAFCGDPVRSAQFLAGKRPAEGVNRHH